ncbi:MAG: cytochrome c biogenesis CcdA family protein [Actinomycetaceae bacterium]|nr:cytochrome c biogenesis CcdA family protein [Actinomycetaceae bacterium]
MNPVDVTIPIALLAGLLSFLSPCFLPLVPVFLTSVVGKNAGRGRALINAAAFIAAFSCVFVSIWASLALIGWAVADYQNTWRIIAGVVIIVLGMQVAGFIRLPFLEKNRSLSVEGLLTVPQKVRVGAVSSEGRLRASDIFTEQYTQARGAQDITQADRSSHKDAMLKKPSDVLEKSSVTTLRATLLGLAFGAGWTPCIGPVLGAILALATTRDTTAQGMLLMLAFCFGLGLPFLAIAAGADFLESKGDFFGRHQKFLRLLAGVLLIITGLLIVTDLFAKMSGWLLWPL